MTNDEKRDLDFRADMAEFAARQRRQEKIIAFLCAIVLIMSLVVLFAMLRSENVASTA